MAKGPRIGITVTDDPKDIPNNYIAAIERAGGEPVVLRPSAKNPPLAKLDGLILSGGGDVNPVIYKQKKHPKTSLIDNARDEFELKLTKRAMKKDVPVLGICRGFQVLNVAYGGGLLQHVDGHASVHGVSGKHQIDVAKDTKLARSIGAHGPLPVNSRHHQAVNADVLAPGLRASAMGPDNIIEGIEDNNGRWVVGLQCHPEKADEVDEHFRNLFQEFVNEAAKHGASKRPG